MSIQILTEAEALLHEVAAKLKSIGHAGADKVHHLIAELRGEEGTLEHDAIADGEQLAKDAEVAAAPVVAEAEADAAKLGSEAVADAEQAVTPTPPASA